jgi:hypothetical protein
MGCPVMTRAEPPEMAGLTSSVQQVTAASPSESVVYLNRTGKAASPYPSDLNLSLTDVPTPGDHESALSLRRGLIRHHAWEG